VPAPHKVTIAGVATMLAERLTCDGLPVAYEIDGAALVTYADGSDGVRREPAWRRAPVHVSRSRPPPARRSRSTARRAPRSPARTSSG
jgi:hypothetical protein